jgi:hypothetical protein
MYEQKEDAKPTPNREPTPPMTVTIKENDSSWRMIVPPRQCNQVYRYLNPRRLETPFQRYGKNDFV